MLTIRIAGLTIGMEDRSPDMRKQCSAYLTEAEPDFTVCTTREEIMGEFERQHIIDLWPLETVCLYRNIAGHLPAYDAFVMHAVVIELDGKAYLFTAPSGTGKTTHSLLWLEAFPEASILNGDKPIIRKLDGVFHACDTPWQGKERMGNGHIRPIAGLCFLHRGEQNTVCRTTAAEVLPELFNQIYVPPVREQAAAFLELLGDFAQTVPLYTMSCNRDISAAYTAREAMA